MCSSPKTLFNSQILGNNHFEDANSLLRLFLLPVVFAAYLCIYIWIGL